MDENEFRDDEELRDGFAGDSDDSLDDTEDEDDAPDGGLEEDF